MSYQPPTGRDPLQSFDRQPPPPVPVESYAPPSNMKFVWLIVAAVIAIVGVLFVPRLLASDDPAPTPTVQQTPAESTVDPNVNGIPWETASGKGFWQIDRHEFTGTDLAVTMTLRVDEGTLNYDWFAFDARATNVYDPSYSDPEALRPSRIGAGETRTGVVHFTVEPGPITIILANASGRQITALMVRP